MKRLAIMTLCALLATASGCAKREAACCPCEPGAQQLDQALMLLLSTARSLHHQADLLERQGEAAQAEATVRKILALEWKGDWPEAEEARLDALARVALMRLEARDLAGALKEADRGIEGAARESFYLSNLHAVRGEVLESRVKALDEEGKKDEAKAAARQAMAAFEASIAINKRLQARLGQTEAKP